MKTEIKVAVVFSAGVVDVAATAAEAARQATELFELDAQVETAVRAVFTESGKPAITLEALSITAAQKLGADVTTLSSKSEDVADFVRRNKGTKFAITRGKGGGVTLL